MRRVVTKELTAQLKKSLPAGRVDVLHISEAYGGGVQSAIDTYIRHSEGVRHQLFVRGRVGHDSGDTPDVEMIRVDASLLGFYAKAARHIRKAKPAVVHLHSSYAGLLRALPNIEASIVYSPHCFAFYRTEFPRILRSGFVGAEILLAQRRQVIAGVSPYETAVAQRFARSSGRTSVRYLPNISSVESEVARKAGASLRSNEPPTLVCVGRISRQKDPDFLAKTLEQYGSAIRCVWVGDGEPQLRGVLEKAGVHVTGWVTSQEAHDLISRADLYVHPAEWEGAPITLVDAAALGVPILVRGIPHLDGLGFVKAGVTPRDLADSIHRFFTDSAYRTRVSVQTIETLSVHSSTAQRRALSALYRRKQGN